MADLSIQPVVDREPVDRLSPAPPWAIALKLMAASEARTRAWPQPEPAADLLAPAPDEAAKPRTGQHTRAPR